MKKSNLLIGFSVLVFFYLTAMMVTACSIDSTPHFEVKTNEINGCWFRSYDENISQNLSVVEFIKERDSSYNSCDGLILSPEDEEWFRKTIEGFNKDRYIWESIYIQEQTDQEYTLFLEQVESKNSDKCDCETIGNVTRNGKWTMFLKGEDCGHNSACTAVPPEGCLGRVPYYLFQSEFGLLGILLVFPLIIIFGFMGIAIFVFRKISSGKSKFKTFFEPKWSKSFIVVALFFVSGFFFNSSSPIRTFLLPSSLIGLSDIGSLILLVISQLIYWYLLTCVIVFLYNKLKGGNRK